MMEPKEREKIRQQLAKAAPELAWLTYAPTITLENITETMVRRYKYNRTDLINIIEVGKPYRELEQALKDFSFTIKPKNESLLYAANFIALVEDVKPNRRRKTEVGGYIKGYKEIKKACEALRLLLKYFNQSEREKVGEIFMKAMLRLMDRKEYKFLTPVLLGYILNPEGFPDITEMKNITLSFRSNRINKPGRPERIKAFERAILNYLIKNKPKRSIDRYYSDCVKFINRCTGKFVYPENDRGADSLRTYSIKMKRKP